jgi:gluconolactonase
MLFADGLSQPETPVALPDGSWLLVEMGGEHDGRISRVDSQGVAAEVAPAGRPNGVALDADDVVWICEAGRGSVAPSISRVGLDGRGFEVVLSGYHDEPFRLPNDLVFGPDGALYFTDSGATINDLIDLEPSTIRFDGRVYRYDPATEALTLLDTGLWFANGITWSHEEDAFYVAETVPGSITRYRVNEGGEVVNKELVGNVIDPDRELNGLGGPDGFAIATNGDIYCTVFGQGIVTVMDYDGQIKDRIETEDLCPTNCAFALDDSELYVTGLQKGLIEVFDVDARGAAVHAGRSRAAS